MRKTSSRARLGLLCYLGLLASAQASGVFSQAALVARTNILVQGTVVVDSFDSRDPSYSANGNYTPLKRKDGGNIILAENVTNATIRLSEPAGGSVAIYGKAYIGPANGLLQAGGLSVGSTNWIDGGNVGAEPGWLVQYPGSSLPDAPTPPIGGLPLPSKGTYSLMGASYTNSYLLVSGNYQVTSLSLASSAKILVQGSVRFSVTGDLTMSGQSQIIMATNSSLEIYAAGTVDLSGGGVINHTRFASNLTIYGLNTCTNIYYTGGSDLIGTICAPKAAFRMSGGGNTAYHFVGSVAANSITINGKYQVHYDESLLLWPLNVGPVLGSPAIAPNGTIQFSGFGVPGYHYVIEATTNFIDWLPVATNRSPFYFTNNEAPSPRQFFRATYLPPPW